MNDRPPTDRPPPLPSAPPADAGDPGVTGAVAPRPQPPATIGYAAPGAGDTAHDRYHRVADTVGFVPSVRLSDNLVSLGGGLAGAVLGVAAGVLFTATGGQVPWTGVAVGGGILGFIGGVIVAGLVLGIVRLVNRARR